MYRAWNVCTPVGKSAVKFDVADVGATGPAVGAIEGMSGWLTGTFEAKRDAMMQ
jgi:hypothetical protein